MNDNEEKIFLKDSGKIPDWYPEHQFYGIVKKRPSSGSKFILNGRFITFNNGYILKTFRKRVWKL